MASRRVLIAAVAVVLLSPLLGAWSAYSSLRRAVDAVDGARVELASGSGDLEPVLLDALADSDHAVAVMDDPLVRGLAAVTGTRDSLDAARLLAANAREATAIALRSWRAVAEMKGDVFIDGRLDFVAVEDLAATLEEAARDLETVRSRLLENTGGGLDALDEAYVEARGRLGAAIRGLEGAVEGLRIAPALFAQDTTREYLVAFLSPSEARGGGGLPGVFAVLTATDGALELTEIHPNEDLNARLKKEVAAPAWFQDLYGGLGALDDVRQANLSPVFPTTARVLLRMYREAFGRSLDGVVAMDPIVLGKMSRPLGPLSAPGWGVEITASNARRLLLQDIYKRFPRSFETAQNRYLSGLIRTVWTEVGAGDYPVGSMGAALADAAATQHLKVFARAPEVRKALVTIGAASDPRTSPNPHVFFHNNFTGSKVDHHVDRSHSITVDLDEQGSAHVAWQVTIENTVPVEPIGVINRPLNKELPVGLARMTVHALLPENATNVETQIDSAPKRFFRGRDAGLVARWSTLDVPSGGSATITITYSLPAAASGGSFSLTLWPQATAFPDHYEISIRPSPGVTVADHDLESEDDGVLESAGALKRPVTLGVRLAD